MDMRTVTPDLSVAPQISAGDLKTIADDGFKTVINVRPDGEEPGQPTSSEMEAVAKALGLSYAYIPVTPGQLSNKEVMAFAEACDKATGPVFSYCRSGTRAVTLWALANRGKMAPSEIAAKAHAAGYDLPPAITGA